MNLIEQLDQLRLGLQCETTRLTSEVDAARADVEKLKAKVGRLERDTVLIAAARSSLCGALGCDDTEGAGLDDLASDAYVLVRDLRAQLGNLESEVANHELELGLDQVYPGETIVWQRINRIIEQHEARAKELEAERDTARLARDVAMEEIGRLRAAAGVRQDSAGAAPSKTRVDRSDRRHNIELAIRKITEDAPNGQPNNQAEALIAGISHAILSHRWDALSSLWPLFLDADADLTRDLREAANVFFGGDFGKPEGT